MKSDLDKENNVPDGQLNLDKSHLAPQVLLETIRSRRSVRKFRKDMIPQDILDQIFEAARWAPTNCNKQLWKIVAITDEDIKNQLVQNAGSSTLILTAPVILAVTHLNDVFIEAYQSSSAVIQNILLMAKAHGIGSLWLNSKGNPAKIRELLRIPEEYIVICFVLLGYPEKIPKNPPPRKSISQFFSYNQFSGTKQQPWVHDPSKWNFSSLIDYQKFICRKTELGTAQDVFSETELEIVKRVSCKFKEPHLDLFSYDGQFLKEFINKTSVTAVDTCKQTVLYTLEALKNNKNLNAIEWDQLDKLSAECFKTASLIFRAERLPPDVLDLTILKTFEKLERGGEFYLVFRNRNLLFVLFCRLFVKILGDNLSKTAIFSFFGPYKPVATNVITRKLKDTGFEVSKKKYCPLPPIFEKVAELMIQYKISAGGNFLHHTKRSNKLLTILNKIIRMQLNLNISWFGSIVVLIARK